MWKNDLIKIQEIYERIINGEKVRLPTICPICKSKTAYYYIHRNKDIDNRGAAWIWCSNCKQFDHGTINFVPDWWKNCKDILFEKLFVVPDYLEENKETIVMHVNKLILKNGDKYNNK